MVVAIFKKLWQQYLQDPDPCCCPQLQQAADFWEMETLN